MSAQSTKQTTPTPDPIPESPVQEPITGDEALSPEPLPPVLLDKIFQHRYTESDGTDSLFKKTLQKLANLPKPNKMPGKPLKEGVIGFRRNGRNINLTIACGRAIVRQIELLKFVTMIEKMDSATDSTIVLENFADADEYKASRGQILGRFNPKYSCITVAQGLTGRVIHSASDVVRMDAYYLNKDILTAFYITSKLQLGMEDTLTGLIGAYDGWKVFDLPEEPCNPDNEVDE